MVTQTQTSSVNKVKRFLAHVCYYHRLLNVFFLLSSEQKRENEFATNSIRYSHHHHCHFNSGNNRRAKNAICKQTFWKKVVLGYLFKN